MKLASKNPFLAHADGLCHVYVDKSADMQMEKNIALDAKTDYPAACNAMETLLVHKDLMENGGVNALLIELQTKGVGINHDPRASCMLNLPSASSYYHEYGSLACTIEIVVDVHAAIESLIINIRMEGRTLIVRISTSMIHSRGPVGVEGLLTTRWIVRGNGHSLRTHSPSLNYTCPINRNKREVTELLVALSVW
ncbi:hypothetical protein L1987_63399 [Smallanthus sonchifolius]|uniref:Uncharacterized protein n=1 Tax=Smallanthus sonchifolius TaxID=185202 RepID=A0ACB9CDC9_9ASTR|nr:hypothetical protein L1987_63399 [Smallanthus sonchifolius]